VTLPIQCELCGVEGYTWRAAEEALHRKAAVESAEHGAVLRREAIEIIRSLHGTCTGHVLCHDGRIAGEMLAQVAGKHTGI
jgi:hypothetical protein